MATPHAGADQPVSLLANLARNAVDPTRVALTLGPESRTYAELVRRATALAAGLATRCGVRPGDRVALLARNRIEYLEVELGVSHAGAVLVAMSWRYTTVEAVAVLARSGAGVALVDPELMPGLLAARATGELPDLRVVVAFGAGSSAADDYAELLEAGASTDWAAEEQGRSIDPHEIIFTSGTTGLPKGAIWTTGGVVWNALQQIADFTITRESVTYVSFDLNYIGGRHQLVWAILLQGGTVHLKRSGGFAAEEVFAAVVRHGVTHLLLVPTMLGDVLDLLERRPAEAPALRMIMCGGAPVPAAMLERAARLLPGVWVAHVYGLTEGGGTVCFVPPATARDKPGSAGVPSLNARIRVRSETGPAAPGEIGEVEVLAPTLCAGYWGDIEATRALFDDGWLRTGDLGFLDADGFLFLTGRRKELIISGGMNVFPAEVEAVLEQHPAVRHAAVFGVPHQRWGETVAAAVELLPGHATTSQQLVELCRERLSGYKLPTVVWFVEQLPRTPSGKIRKYDLVERYAGRAGDG
ncbi:class I adenylate-forming enzyme family protein [Nocardioides sp.]|uniref:class I adenylate-forming enzyme family protein n=1 Tax=Nocardioides sp. TaxID=35761 RepID=UPI0039E234B1